MNEEIKNNSKLLYLQAKYYFDKAMEKFNDGTIKSEPKLVQEVFSSFQDFFTSLGKPFFVPRYVQEMGPAWSEDYNEMMSDIQKDLELLFQEIDILGKTLYTDFNHNVMQHDILEKEYNAVFNKLKDLEIYANFSSETIQFERDDFLNADKIDFDRISSSPLEITNNGVRLKTRGEPVNVAKFAKVTIVPGNRHYDQFIIGSDSNGFPGNNHEVTVLHDPLISSGNNLSFVGRDNNHGNYGAVLDGNPNTWFEYERVNLRDHEKIRIAKNLGWKYHVYDNKTLTFAEDPENGILKLHMQVVLPEIKLINQININMYTPPNYGAQPAIVKTILISDGENEPVPIVYGKEPQDKYTFMFDPIYAKVISIFFEQPTKYYTDIGHIYFEEKLNIKNQQEYVFDTITKQYKPKYAPRIEGPMINIEELGAKIDIKNTDVEVYYPMKEAESEGYILQDIIDNITNRIDLKTIDMGIERFEGWRYCIGIRDIEILSCEYEQSGEIVTKPFYFNNPLTKVSLSVNETIPSLFQNNPIIKYDWIKYYFSIDDGSTWHPITPLEHEVNKEDMPPKIYTIYQSDNQNSNINGYGYIESPYPVYSLRLKIVIERPEDDANIMALSSGLNNQIQNTFHTPTLQRYMINVETHNNEFDTKQSKQIIQDSDHTTDDISFGETPGDQTDTEPNTNDIIIQFEENYKEWCISDDLIIKGTVTNTRNIQSIELYVNGVYYSALEGTTNNELFEFTIPKDELELGSNLSITIIAQDGLFEVRESKIIKIISCNETAESIEVNITSKINELCKCHDLIIAGVISSPSGISEMTLLINDQVIDPYDLGEPPENNPCQETNPVENEITAFSEEFSFHWVIPYWKLHQLGVEVDSKVNIQVLAFSGDFMGEDSFAFTVAECSSGEEEPINTCYQLDTIIVEYFDEIEQKLNTIEVGPSFLPFELNNESTTVKISWNKDFSSVIVGLTSKQEQNIPFVISSIGIRYYDFEKNEQTKWGSVISDQSNGAVNTEKILGSPEEKDQSWLEEVIAGNYDNTPCLKEVEDYIMIGFDEDWFSNACEVPVNDYITDLLET